MDEQLTVVVRIKETETNLKEALLAMGVDAAVFGEENCIWGCEAHKNGNGTVTLAFEEGAVLTFKEEKAAADFLYMVLCHCLYLQMLTVDFGGMLGILGASSPEQSIVSTDWEEREAVPFWTSVLCTNVMPDVDDPELSFQWMEETDEALMERFAEDSQLMMIFGEVEQAQRRLFWLEV